MEKYNYLVKPRIPIRNVIPGQIINREKVLSLELEQVKSCLRHGPVFRKFASNDLIQVTLDNCDRLHRRDYVSEIKTESTFIKPEKEAKKEIATPVVEEEDVQVKEEVIEADQELVEAAGLVDNEDVEEVLHVEEDIENE